MWLRWLILLGLPNPLQRWAQGSRMAERCQLVGQSDTLQSFWHLCQSAAAMATGSQACNGNPRRSKCMCACDVFDGAARANLCYLQSAACASQTWRGPSAHCGMDEDCESDRKLHWSAAWCWLPLFPSDLVCSCVHVVGCKHACVTERACRLFRGTCHDESCACAAFSSRIGWLIIKLNY